VWERVEVEQKFENEERGEKSDEVDSLSRLEKGGI
jgi:hypothetical protein